MIRFSAAVLLFTAAAAFTPARLAAQMSGGYSPAQVDARIWVTNEREYFRRGDRMNVNFSVSGDAYVAVIHIDTDGNLDFLFPVSPWDNEWVRGGRVHSLPARGGMGGWTVRGQDGIGYFYILASPDPLDFGYFRGPAGSRWDWGYAGQTVRGDPFLAFEQVTQLLLPRAPYPRYVYDYYGYYVGRQYPYPTYACSDQYYSYGWGWNPSYGSCGRQDYFLRIYPSYYDTRRYRGDRRHYLRQYASIDPRRGFLDPRQRFGDPRQRFVDPRQRFVDPRHGFKEAPDRAARGVTSGNPRPTEQGGQGQIPRRDGVTPNQPPPQPGARPQAQGRAPAAQPARVGNPGGTRERPTSGVGGSRTPATPPSSGGNVGTRERPAPTAGGTRAPASGRPAAPAPERRPAVGRP